MDDMAITVTVCGADGAAPGEGRRSTLAAFIADNADGLDGAEIAALREALSAGDEYPLGGGTAPLVIVAPAP